MSIPVDIRPASFRGVAFEALEVGGEVGRRHAEHSFPQRDEPQVDDIGRKIRRWTLQAFVLGDDVGVRAEALENACEAAGAGTLNHPTKGTFSVKCSACRSTRSTRGVNYVEYSLDFVEAGTVFEPIPSPAANTQTWTDDLLAAVNAYYDGVWLVTSVARKVQRMATASWSERLVAMLELGGLLASEDVSDYTDAVRTAQDAVDSGERAADTLSGYFADIMESVSTSAGARGLADSLGVYVVASSAALTAGADTDTDDIILSNTAASDAMQYTQAITRAASLAASEDWTSYDEALAASTDLSDRLADLGLYGVDADTYAAALDVRAGLVASIQDSAGTLPRLRDVTLPTPTSMLVLAYDLYEDAERAQEIVDRNGIGDPGSVTGTLKVLTS